MNAEISDAERERAATKFVAWLENRVLHAGRGDGLGSLDVDPDGKFWLGRIAPEERVIARGLGERGERLEPCAIGIRCRPAEVTGTLTFHVTVSCHMWQRTESGQWEKRGPAAATIRVDHDLAAGVTQAYGSEEIAKALSSSCGRTGRSAEIRVESEQLEGQQALSILLVNTSPDKPGVLSDTNLYECRLEVAGLATEPFMLAALPDSFRYDRTVPAYGMNVGVDVSSDGVIATRDTPSVDRRRPIYWNSPSRTPDLRFDTLSADPIPALESLATSLGSWGVERWGEAALRDRALRSNWTDAMHAEAREASAAFFREVERLKEGIALLRESPTLKRAFIAMNRAMSISARGAYDGWRPFQIGFQLVNLKAIVDPDNESRHVDVVWFATGGGKTETYLGQILTAAFYDRLTGKRSGITAWSRFPLRMLSLQQTQRFANALAGGEIVRREMGIDGEPFSLGFFVGQSSTPNSIKPDPKDGEFDPEDDDAPRRYQVLGRCPFCRKKSIDMAFDRRIWRLEHRCVNDECPWPERALPFYIVDDEIYRYLPTVVVGTLDKAASIAIQASMRGFVGAPLGRCSQTSHGYVYAPRSNRPHGCLVPGCRGTLSELDMDPALYPPSLRLQDELHLLKDSLGAVDAHYEALYDDLQSNLSGRRAKILASSATLAGFEKQVDVLYGRTGRVFPQPGPSHGDGFWTADSDRLMRRFVAVAPRGLTVEYAIDRMLTELQTVIRELVADPVSVCAAAEIDPLHAEFLVSNYGTQVVYGNTLRDLDAIQRSLTTQIPVDGELRTASLTGRDQFEDIRQTLERLETPEQTFGDRLHIVTASSMMSHGVDIDRLNVMVMVGLPLATSEFIQATARVGRKWPGLVFVIHKIGRERDAGVFRSFEKFIEQGDRFVEAIPITKRSRRVLECTLAGLEFARVLMLAEPESGRALTTAERFRTFAREGGIDTEKEAQALIDALHLADPIDEPMREAIKHWFADFRRNIEVPPPNTKWPSDLSPTGGPMISLRDVEQQVPVSGSKF